MRSKVLAVAVASALGLISHVAFAQDSTDASNSKPVRTHRTTSTSASDKAEIEMLKSQLAALQAQLNAQAAQVSALQERTDAQSDINVSQGQATEATQKQVAATQKYVDDAKAGKLDYKGIQLTLGGFLEAASIYRSKDVGADMASSFAIPYNQTSTAHTHETRFSERQSRLSLLATADINPDVHVSGYYEGDFLGAAQTANQNQSNSFTPRTRNVYAALDWDTTGLHLLAGDSWSLLTLNAKGITPRTEQLPPSIDAQYVPGFTWARQNQIRIVKDWGKVFWLGLSLENPQTTFATTKVPAGVTYNQVGGSGFNSANNISLNQTPDVILKAALDPGWGHYEVFGLGREFYNRFGGSNHTEHGGGFGLGMILPLVPKILDFQFSGMTGKGIGRYGTAGLSDVTFRPDGSLAPIKETMLLGGLTLHAGSDVDVYAFGGQERQQKEAFTVGTTPYGYGNPLYVNSGCDIEGSPLTCVGNTQKISQGTLGFWWRFYQGKYGKVQFGAQASHTERKAFDGVGGAPSANDNMLFTSLRYYPF